MNPVLPLERSYSVKPLPLRLLSGMHSHESVVYFRFWPGNIRVLQSSLSPETGIRFDIFGVNIPEFFGRSGSNQWRKRLYAMLHIHLDHSFTDIQFESFV